MKKYFLLLLIFIIISCQYNTDGKATFIAGDTLQINGFTFITDTIIIQEKGTIIIPELKHNDKYYCLSSKKDSLGEYKLSNFYIIDNQKYIRKMESMLNYMEFAYNDIHIRHDSIVVNSYFDKTTFYLNEKKEQWQQIKNTDDVIFEDDDYYVTALDFGEWGSATWFKDKKTGIEHEAAGILPPEINKFNGAYYLISPSEINVVTNPKLLYPAGKGAYKSFLGKDALGKFSERKHGDKHTGMKTIFSRKITYEREDDFFIVLSFIHNNTLCYIVNDSVQTHIAKVEDNKLIPVAKIGSDLHTRRYTNQYRNLYLNKTLHFYNLEEKLYGLLEIKGNDIFIHYFKNR